MPDCRDEACRRSTVVRHNTLPEQLKPAAQMFNRYKKIDRQEQRSLACLQSRCFHRPSMDYTYGLMAHRARYTHSFVRKTDPAKRVIIALAGPPGSGKSTAAQKVADLLNKDQSQQWIQVLPMDGFHFPRSTLDEFPNKAEAYTRRGVDWTFDATKLLEFVHSLRKSKTTSMDVIHAPGFDHAAKDPLPNAIEIGPSISLVILEGSWLLLDQQPWNQISSLADDTWFIDVDPKLARRRIAQRHVRAGIETDMSHALSRTDANDMINGEKIRSFLVPPRFKVQSIETQQRLSQTRVTVSAAAEGRSQRDIKPTTNIQSDAVVGGSTLSTLA